MILRNEALPTVYEEKGFNWSSKTTISEATDFTVYTVSCFGKDLVSTLNTVVHEMSHGYTSRAVHAYNRKHETEEYVSMLFYFSEYDQVPVHFSPTFSSTEIVSMIPDSLRTFRFDTYVGSPSEYQSTRQDGVYGLLGEWHAYYLGTRTSYRLFDYYKRNTSSRKEGLPKFMQGVDGTLYAHMEFKFFVLTYLLYAQEHHPEVYDGLMDNRSFRRVYRRIDGAFTQLIKDYQNLRDEQLRALEKEGYETRIGEHFTYIDGSGTGHFMDEYRKLERAIAAPAYQKMIAQLKSGS